MAPSDTHRCEGPRVGPLINGRPPANEPPQFVRAWARPRRPTAGLGVLAALLLILAGPGQACNVAADDPTPEQFEADFDALWLSLDRNYAYFDVKQTDWAAVRSIYRPNARAVKTRAEFVEFLERVLEELYDPHTHLDTNTASSPRLVPSGADLWAEWRGDAALVVEVRPGSAASRAGLRPGMEVVSFNGKAISDVVEARLGRSLRRRDPAARDWALRAVLAGRRDETRNLGIRSGQAARSVALDDSGIDPQPRGAPEGQLLEHRRLPAGIGYIRINDSLARVETVAAFDAALAELRGTRGLVLDLRDTPSGGNSTVARGLMGRLVDRETAYQKHALLREERDTGIRRSWLEMVSPRGPFTYRQPLVVLVDHWTGSMGEGIAIGLDGARRARVVGTRMAGLLGAKASEFLAHSRIQVSFPKEKLFHVDGTPRESYRPKVEVDLLRAGEGTDDPILEAGMQELGRKPR
jgi:carboxyl-terminal processing protease